MKDATKFKIHILSLCIYALLIGYLFPYIFDTFFMLIRSDSELWNLKILWMVLLATPLAGWLMLWLLKSITECFIETIKIKKRMLESSEVTQLAEYINEKNNGKKIRQRQYKPLP